MFIFYGFVLNLIRCFSTTVTLTYVLGGRKIDSPKITGNYNKSMVKWTVGQYIHIVYNGIVKGIH